MHLFNSKGWFRRPKNATTNSASSMIKSSLVGKNPMFHYNLLTLTKSVVLTVFELCEEKDNDKESWRWFKNPEYKGMLGLEKIVTYQTFKMFGGPKYVSKVYEKLKEQMDDDRIEDLEFLIVLKFYGHLLIFSFWKRDGDIIRVYVIWEWKIDKFCEHAGNYFKAPYEKNGIPYVNWKRSMIDPEGETEEKKPQEEEQGEEDKCQCLLPSKMADSWMLPTTEPLVGDKVIWRPSIKYINKLIIMEYSDHKSDQGSEYTTIPQMKETDDEEDNDSRTIQNTQTTSVDEFLEMVELYFIRNRRICTYCLGVGESFCICNFVDKVWTAIISICNHENLALLIFQISCSVLILVGSLVLTYQCIRALWF